MREIVAVAGIENTSDAFRRKAIRIADRLGLNADYLFAVMSFESARTFRADKKNPRSGAMGLIQFTKGPAAKLGTTREKLSKMTPERQLDYVEGYYKPFGPLTTLEQHYLAVFRGTAHLSPEAVLFTRPPEGCPKPLKGPYCQNKEFDKNNTGVITARMATTPVRNIYEAGKTRPPVLVDMSMPPPGYGNGDKINIAGAIILFGLAAWTFGRFNTRARRLK